VPSVAAGRKEVRDWHGIGHPFLEKTPEQADQGEIRLGFGMIVQAHWVLNLGNPPASRGGSEQQIQIFGYASAFVLVGVVSYVLYDLINDKLKEISSQIGKLAD
jgi:hypothetical protein